MSHYFTNDSNLESQKQMIKVKVLKTTFKFITDNGVFSKDFLDFGTKLLIDAIVADQNLTGDILDVGCGYGGLGLVIASQTPFKVTMVDVNERALDLCLENAKLNKIDNIEVFESNVYDNVNQKYQTIITNPPIRAGKQVVHDIILSGYDYLNDGGCLYLVIKKQHGAKSAIKALELKYKEVNVLNKEKGYFIIKCEK